MNHSMQRVTEAAIGVTAGGTGLAVWLNWIQGTAATVAAVIGAIIACITLYRMLRDPRNGKKP
jgi:type IV secretory pathway VirB2 component (pilin)